MYPKRWQTQVIQAVLLLVCIAIAARLVETWLLPLLPIAISVAVLLIVYRLIIRGRWR
jgi:hypothetical protein